MYENEVNETGSEKRCFEPGEFEKKIRLEMEGAC